MRCVGIDKIYRNYCPLRMDCNLYINELNLLDMPKIETKFEKGKKDITCINYKKK